MKEVIKVALLSLLLAFLMYIIMIVINGLANTLPLNGITTGAVSFQYPNLFQPSGITFSIWGIIYLLLFICLIFQCFKVNHLQNEDAKHLFVRINLLFTLTSLFNVLWLLAWHYDKMIISTVIMLTLLVTLIVLVKIIPSTLSIVRASFSVYLGWITVASIANITIMLVKIGFPNDGIIAIIMTIGVLLVGTAISFLWIIREKDYIFGFVIIWAYIGIFIRHIKQENLSQMYPSIYITVILSITCLIIANALVMKRVSFHT